MAEIPNLHRWVAHLPTSTSGLALGSIARFNDDIVRRLDALAAAVERIERRLRDSRT
jgi:hypothetical protein